MTSRTPVDRHQTLRLLGALAGLSVALGACNTDHGGRDRAAFPTIIACVIRSRSRKPTARSSCSSARRAAACPLRSAPTSRDWRRPGFAKAPARSSPTCRSIRRMRAPRRPHIREIQAVAAWRAACRRAPSRCTTIVRTIPRRSPTIRLSYPRIAAVAGPCGLWPEDLGPNRSTTRL